MKYRFTDPTGKPRQTVGEFVGCTPPTGADNVEYAVFRHQRGATIIPVSWLTDEAAAAIDGKGTTYEIEVLS